MKPSKVTGITIVALGLTLALMGFELRHQTYARGVPDGPRQFRVESPPGRQGLSKARGGIYSLQARLVFEGVVAPLNSLPIMQRAIAAADSEARQVPALDLLNAPLKTTGLGPIRIGMTLDEVEAAGLKLAPMDGSNGECQYYRIEDYVEPLGLMAIDNRILRIDVWPGSLTEALSGAKIGSTEDELTNFYGDQLEASPNPITLGKTIVFTPKDPGEDIYRLVFETDDRGRVVQYRAGQFPSVTWPEGCL